MTTSTKKSFPLYAEQLEKILAVTRMLNENSYTVDLGETLHIKVSLVDSVSNETIGEWNDEAASDDWEFAIVQEEKPKFNPHVTRIEGGGQTFTPRDGFQPVNSHRTISERAADQRPMPVEKPITGHDEY
jgi:hypothetical protein